MYSPHHTPNTSPKKPSPLSYTTNSNPNSPRASPFKRAQSPAVGGSTNAQTSSPSTPRVPPRTPSSTVRAGTGDWVGGGGGEKRITAAPPSQPGTPTRDFTSNPPTLRARPRTPSSTVRAGTPTAPAPNLSRSGDWVGVGGGGERITTAPPSQGDWVGFGGGGERITAAPPSQPRTPTRDFPAGPQYGDGHVDGASDAEVKEVFGSEAAARRGEGASPAVALRDAVHWSPNSSPRASPAPSHAAPVAAVDTMRSGSPVVNARGSQHGTPRAAVPMDNRRNDSGHSKTTGYSYGGGGVDALSKVHPARLREMHESFQVLDRNSDGLVDRGDVADMLGQLGQPNDPHYLSTFFPTTNPSTTTTTNLPNYLQTLSALLTPLSSTHELAAAFSAFDTDDSGQIDAHELRQALCQGYDGARGLNPGDVDAVLEEFGGRRAFGGGAGVKGRVGMAGMGGLGGGVNRGRGDVFRWREFVGAVAGGERAVDEGEGGQGVVA